MIGANCVATCSPLYLSPSFVLLLRQVNLQVGWCGPPVTWPKVQVQRMASISASLIREHQARSRTMRCRRLVLGSLISFIIPLKPPPGICRNTFDTAPPQLSHANSLNRILGREFARWYGKEGILRAVQNPGNLRAGGYDNVDAFTMFFIGPLLHEPRFGGYTELYAGLSPDITLENNGSYVIPWGRLRPDKGCPRKDILNAMTPEEDGGLGYGKKFWEWCELKWKQFI